MASTWFITGTSSGFGRHMTELLLERGDRVGAVRHPHHADRARDGRHGLLLGSDAYALVRDALTARLEAIEAQREVALGTDRDDFEPAGGAGGATPG